MRWKWSLQERASNIDQLQDYIDNFPSCKAFSWQTTACYYRVPATTIMELEALWCFMGITSVKRAGGRLEFI